jgi:hypothetical protein
VTVCVQQPRTRYVSRELCSVRNPVLEYLQSAASFEEQQQYEGNVLIAYVPGEGIFQWEDSFSRGLEQDLAQVSVFPEDEMGALRDVELTAVAAGQAMPVDYPALPAVQALPAWQALRGAASSALAAFERRGRLSGDEQVL